MRARLSSPRSTRPLALVATALAVLALAAAAHAHLHDGAHDLARRAELAATSDPGQGDEVPALASAQERLYERENDEQDHLHTLHARADPFAPIAIASTLPSLSSSPPSLAAAFSAHLSSLTSLASTLSSAALPPALSSRLSGVPGTALSSARDARALQAHLDARALQAHLDCVSSRGEWVHDPAGAHLAARGRGLTVHKQDGRYAACDRRFYKGREARAAADEGGEWDVRPSLQWRWVPSSACATLAPGDAREEDDEPPTRARFCTLLAHKATLLVGDATQYSLHDLLLDYAATTPQSCYGDLYCKEHALCGEVLRAVREGREAEVESSAEDERVHVALPLPPGSARSGRLAARAHEHAERASSPSSRYSSPSYGTLLRYRRSDGLRASSAYTAPTYRHPATGVREVNQPWLADARRSDVVVLTKAPFPLPLRSANASFWEVLDATAEGEERAERVLDLAAEWTARLWLPELLDSLRALRAPPSPTDILVVYRGGWRQHADCASPGDAAAGDGPAPHTAPPDLAALLLAPEVPLHVAWHNAQLVLQNAVARSEEVLPAFGALFLDLETPLSVWRAGMVGSSLSPSASSLVLQAGHGPGAGQGLRTAASGDCTRYCLPSPGLALETHFLGALGRVMRLAWAGDGRAELEWVGEGFVGIREREARRAGMREEKGGGGGK
ncbi:hypothetical protein JCM10450v2_008125 [Rhodotorula kratochvilovae]